MVDTVPADIRSRMMAGIKSRDTMPEVMVRQLLHRSGYRFRLHQKDLPGRPDIVLARFNAAIFINGCFWHGHEDCHLFRPPKSRQEFWEKKILGNRMRDRRKQKELFDLGWRVGVIWECAMKGRLALEQSVFLAGLEKFVCGEEKFFELRGIQV